MPIHDWSRVDANLFHDFHQTWTINLRNALNGGLLPSGYSALVEQHAGGVVPDVIALEQNSDRQRDENSERGGVVLATPPKTRHVLHAAEEAAAARANRIAIHHQLGDIVCVIAIVSPGNKSSRGALRNFVGKAISFLRQGVNLLIVDLLPPTVRDPSGIHKAIWDEIEEQPFELPSNQRLTLAAYVADTPKTAYIEPVGVGESLPDMPAYLNSVSYVPVPLEATYQATWDSCPLAMRRIIEQG